MYLFVPGTLHSYYGLQRQRVKLLEGRDGECLPLHRALRKHKALQGHTRHLGEEHPIANSSSAAQWLLSWLPSAFYWRKSFMKNSYGKKLELNRTEYQQIRRKYQ